MEVMERHDMTVPSPFGPYRDGAHWAASCDAAETRSTEVMEVHAPAPDELERQKRVFDLRDDGLRHGNMALHARR